MPKAVRIAVSASAVLLVITLAVVIAGIWANPWDHAISFNQDFYIAVWNRGFDSRLVFFNDREYGPYRGSIIALVDSAKPRSPFERELRFGDTWGIYYRYFRWPNGQVLWTLMMSLWYPVAIFAILPLLLMAIISRKRGRAKL
jgi:hypothetical protein